jgi:hypothetical protein
LDEVDNVIWILPFLALLDIVSTFYAAGQEPSMVPYEGGSFSNFFVAGSIYVYLYAVIYMLIIIGITYLLWHIKNSVLEPSRAFDKALFVVVVVVAMYVYARLTAAFLLGFFLPEIISRGINILNLAVIIYAFSFVSLSIYIGRTVLSWVTSGGSKKAE